MLYLLDSSAVLNDFSFEFSQEQGYVTTSLVFNEFRDMRSRHLADNALKLGLLQIQEPSQQAVDTVTKAIEGKGFSKLSKPDKSILGLAFDFKQKNQEFVLVSDDYSIQNFCKILSLPFESVIRGKIKEAIGFSLECSACGKTLGNGEKARNCPVCGTALKKVKNKA